MKKIIALLVLLGMGAFTCYAAPYGSYQVNKYSVLGSTTANTEINFYGTDSADMLGRVVISTGSAGVIEVYDAAGSTDSANLISTIDGNKQNVYEYNIHLDNGLTIKNLDGIKAVITGE